MAKHLLFLVNGMGDSKPGWSKPIQDLVRALYRKYDISKLMLWDDHFEFVEVHYNDKFDDRRAAWKAAANEVIGALGEGGMPAGAVTKLTKWAAEPAKDGFLNTHVLDVVMYRYLSLVAQQVRESVQTQILTKLAAQPASDTGRWSIIAHSLGTSVTHDVLQLMFSPNKPPEWGTLPPGIFRPHVLMLLANVSRLLENKGFFGPDGDVYRSAVHPDSDTRVGACDYLINVRHEWDPIPKPQLFRPTDDWPDTQTRAEGRYLSVLINAVEQANVHDFAHYLKNPQSHVPLFRLLTVAGLITDEELATASRKYEESTPLDRFKSEIAKLKKLSLSEGESDWRNILQMLRDFAEGFA